MAKERKMIGRISYVENWHDSGEHFVFEWKFEDEDEKQWSFECAFPLCECKDGKMQPGSGELVHYTALTKIREWAKIGIKDIIWR